MGLFDGFEAGWNSFKNKELKAYTDTWKTIVVDTPTKIVEAVDKGLKESNQPIWERDSTVKIIGEENAAEFKETVENIPEKIKEAVDKGLKESNQPIWERDSTVKIIGDEGADKLQDTLNPARWAENTIDKTPFIPDNAKDTVKTYLPIVALGAGALLLIAALK